MDKTIRIVSREQCTGCGACYNKCPVNAIKMKENRKGFLVPEIDDALCTNCGLCSSSCPAINVNSIRKYKQDSPDCYAMTARESVRKQSSSGGMFTVLAEYVLGQNGIVCGAAFSDDYNSVSHIIVNQEEELGKIRGSKYLQSSTGNTYKQIEIHLKNGGWALFSGTPCQIAGIRTYLNRDYEKLILVDIVCHGAPSPKVYRKYIEEKAKGRKIAKVDFREKSFWGWGTASSLFFEDGSVYRSDCYKDEYWKAFLSGLSTRECCGKCEYANPARIGDFTLGDFWGVASLDRSCDDGKGTTLLLVNSKKAKKLMEILQQKCDMLKQMDYNQVKELAKTRNGQLLCPKETHWASERFFWLVDMKPFSVAFDYAVNSRYDVGVTGWWYNENYGGTLTYFALNKVLRKMGQTVLMISKCSSDPNYRPNEKTIPYRFAKKQYNISKNYTPETIGTLADHCNVFVSGSDQLFNPTLWEYSGPQYFLNYATRKNKIISYASSFGNDFWDPQNLKVPMGYWLRRFDALSARESYGVDLFKNIFGLDAKHVMDPVFLCDLKEYEALAENSGKKKTQDFFVSFFLDPNEEKRNAILHLKDRLNLPYVNLLHAMDFEENKKKLNLDNTKTDIDVEEWLFYYKNADFVITDSFHGTCFAIIFRKNFISVANKKRGANRFRSLLETVGLTDRLVFDIQEIERRPELFDPIDYDRVYDDITPKIRESYEWLEKAVKNSPRKEASEFNALNYEIERLSSELESIKHAMSTLKMPQAESVSDSNYVDDSHLSIKMMTKDILKRMIQLAKALYHKIRK